MISIIIPVLFSCCFNVVFLEILIRYDPGCGNLVTFFQFLTVAIEGFVFTTNFGSVKPKVPLKNYGLLVLLFFAVSIINNYALNFDISMPLHMIFKSGSLVANMLLAIIILKRRYSLNKYISVLMVTVGITVATVASQNLKDKNHTTSTNSGFFGSTSFIGILLLTVALFLSAYLGIYQETLFCKYGKHPKEALFYSHALPLPGFILLAKNVYSHCIVFNQSEPVSLPFLNNVPVMWLYLLCNVVTQYVCVRSVFTLSTVCSSLTVTMVITLRKFVSLVFSILYFQNPFTLVHWIGTFLVFLGTLLFTNVPSLIYEQMKTKQKKA